MEPVSIVRYRRFKQVLPRFARQGRTAMVFRQGSSYLRPLQFEPLEDRRLLDAALQYTHVVYKPSQGNVPAAVMLASPGPVGLTPVQIRAAYGIDMVNLGAITGDGAGQTIAIIDAYDNPKLVSSTDPNFSTSDLARFDAQFGLPDPPSFLKLDQNGGTSYPAASGITGWSLEAALDVEWAHAIAPAANIILIEADSNSYADMVEVAVNTARNLPGVSVISMSFTSVEFSGEDFFDSYFTTPSGHSGVTFLAATGDGGSPGGFPAYSPNVVAVGGTHLNLTGNNYVSETGWPGSGGGQSKYESEPAYQRGQQYSGWRQIPDVAFDADSASGVAVYDSYDYGSSSPWVMVGGTSLSAPCWGGLVAIANQFRATQGLGSLDGLSETLPALYGVPWADYHDITSGSNGGFAAKAGYDLVTGQGTPLANKLVPDLATYVAPPTVSSTTPSLSDGTLPAGTTTFSVNFSEAVVGSGPAADFQLRSLGPDGLLGTADDAIISLSASLSGTTATLTFPALAESVYRLTIRDTLTDAFGNRLDGDGDLRAGGDRVLDFVAVPATPAPVTLTSPHGLPFDVALGNFGAGQLVQGSSNAFDGVGRLVVGGKAFQPESLTYSLSDGGQSLVTANGTVASLTVDRKITVPSTGGEDFARTIDSFTNSTGSPISTTVQIFGNLGSDSGTNVFATSDGNTVISPSDQWIGTDDGTDNYGAPAIIHYVHGPSGLQPSAVSVSGDNIVWTYDITVPANQTVQLAYFTIVSAKRADAMSAANTLVTPRWFGGQAAAFLTASASSSLANFEFPPPTVAGTSPTLTGGSLPAGSTSLAVNFSRPVVGADQAANYQLQSSGLDGLLGTADDAIIPISAACSGATATLGFAALPEQVYRLTVHDAITDAAGHPLQGSGGVTSDWLADFVVVATGSVAPVTLNSPHGLPFDVAVGAFGAGQIIQGSSNAFDGDGRLFVAGQPYRPGTLTYTSTDSGSSVVTASGTAAGLNVSRKVTVPTSGSADLVRTVDTFTNPTASPITTTVAVLGNLGSDAGTAVFATSNGAVNSATQWIGTDDNTDGAGAAAVVHYIHGPIGLTPDSVAVTGDNIRWTYTLTVPAAGTVRLAYFTIVATSRSQATAAANAILGASGFGDQSGSFLTPTEGASLLNFVFPGATPPAISSTTPALSGGMVTAGTKLLSIAFSKTVVGAATAGNYQLTAAGTDGLLGTADDTLIPLSAVYRGTVARLVLPPLMEDLYRLTVRNTITDLAGNALQGSGAGGTGDWVSDFVVVPSRTPLSSSPLLDTGGSNPRAVAVADFNGDGVADVAVTNAYSGSSTVGIFLGDGYGFSNVTTFSSGGTSPVSIAAGDFNRDGILDLAVANSGSYSVGILLGDGTGRFTAASYNCNGTTPQWVTVADFNGDGVLDVAVANTASNTVGILLGTGNGTFGAATTYYTGGSQPNCMVAGDFNRDGSTDLAVANTGTDTVAILLNLGTGSFGSATQIGSGGQEPLTLTMGDFNSDGKSDIAVLNGGRNVVRGAVGILFGNGTGGFSSGTPVALPYYNPLGITSGDFNADGKLDVVVTYTLGDRMGVFLGDGAGGFPVSSMFASDGPRPQLLATADVNGDGKLDLVTANLFSRTLGVFQGNGSGGFSIPGALICDSGGTYPTTAASGDFNRDGKLDLAVANSFSNSVRILVGDGKGGFTATTSLSLGSNRPRFVITADFNGDGKLDLAVNVNGTGFVNIYLGDGQAGFSAGQVCATGGSSATGLTTADFNADGNLDLAVTNSDSSNTVAILVGNGQGGFSGPTTYTTGGTVLETVAAGDFNGDGRPDLAVLNYNNAQIGSVGILLNNGAGGFGSPITFSTGAYNPLDIAAGDLNGDGKIDLAVAHMSNAPSSKYTVGVLLGTGTGGFSAANNYDVGSAAQAVAIADFDQDGINDIGVATNYSVGVLSSNGAGGFLPYAASSPSGAGSSDAVTGDFNSDGKVDLISVNYGSSNLALLPGTGGPAPVTLTSPHSLSFDVDVSIFGAGQILQGASNAFDGDGRLFVGGQAFRPALLGSTAGDSGRSVITGNGTAAGLTVSRRITVPNVGSQDFARTVDRFTNPTGSPISTTVTLVGNLGSDAATTVFATSDGTGVVGPNDQWIGTDDADGTGTPAVIHYIHGPAGLKPSSVSVNGDNITWTYNLTIPAGQTVELACFTIVNSSRTEAVAAANALVTASGFQNQAAAFLTSTDLSSLANFRFLTSSSLVIAAGSGIGTYGGTTTATATLTSDGLPIQNATISFSLNGVGVGTATTNASGIATLNGINLIGFNAGTYNSCLAASFAADSNHGPSSATANLVVNRAPLSVTPANQTKTYGATFTAFAGTVTGIQNGDAITASYSSSGSVAAASVSGGAYAITATLNDPEGKLGNYLVTYNTGSMTVTPAPLTVIANHLSRTYGAANPTLTVRYDGFVNNETRDTSGIAGSPSLSVDATAASPVGNYAITVELNGLTASNYTFTLVNDTLTVTAAPLSVTPANQSKPYGTTFAAFTGTITGIQNGDAITATYFSPGSATTATVAGSPYPITALFNDPDSKLGNYTVTLNQGVILVTLAPLTITPDDQAKIYGNTLTEFTGTITGIQNGDAITASYSSSVRPLRPMSPAVRMQSRRPLMMRKTSWATMQ